MIRSFKKNVKLDDAKAVTNLLECPNCGEYIEMEWFQFPEDYQCTRCLIAIPTQEFEPSIIVYKKKSE